METDLRAHAREIVDGTVYVVLGTVDASGHPWTSPVYFAPGDDSTFYWVSHVETQHSVNLATHPRVSLTVFDSTVLPYRGRAVYAVGEARVVVEPELSEALAVYPRPGGVDVTTLTAEDVSGDSPYRLYAVTASQLWVLCPREPRQPCPLHGLATDHRAVVPAN
jgi:hypothetical protein